MINDKIFILGWSNPLICVLKVNKGLMGLERHEGA